MCQGCRNSLRTADGKILPPPFDLTISRAERRQFRDTNGTLVTPRRETVCHYHCSVTCVKSVDPTFHPSFLHVPDDIKNKLQDLHVNYLQTEF